MQETWKVRCPLCGDLSPGAIHSYLRRNLNRPSFFPLTIYCPNERCGKICKLVFNTTVLDVAQAAFEWGVTEYVMIKGGELVLLEDSQSSWAFGTLRLSNPLIEEMYTRLPNISNYFGGVHG